MKRLFLLSFILLSFLSAEHVRWMGEYDKALALAHTENKPLLVLLVKEKCPECNRLIQDLFMNQSYISLINKNFISVIVTYEGRPSYPIEMYYSRSFPTLFFVDSQRELFLYEPLVGEVKRETIIKIVQNIIKRRRR